MAGRESVFGLPICTLYFDSRVNMTSNMSIRLAFGKNQGVWIRKDEVDLLQMTFYCYN
jgi:hypothetical protein